MIYLGSLGRMIGIKCPASQQLETEETYEFEMTLEGKRTAQVKPRGPRTWSLQTSDATDPESVSSLMQFTQGAWGRGPFVFVSADAPFTNLLSPAAASCDPAAGLGSATVADGPMLTQAGWAGRSLSVPNPAVDVLWFGAEHVPVLPGEWVTGSAYVKGAGSTVRIYWYDISGAQIGQTTSSVTGTAATATRSWVSAVAPPNAVSCRLRAVSTSQAAMPSVTWTNKLMPYSDGQGCPQAVVHNQSRSLTLTGMQGTYSNLSYTVSEVG